MIWKDKNVLITGGSKGIGFEMAKILLEKGAIVHTLSRTAPEFLSPNLFWHKVDLLKDFPEFKIYFDVAILNVGANPGQLKFEDISEDEQERTLYLNLNVHLKVIRRIKCKKIVFIDSILSMTGLPYNSLYCSCKAFIKTFNESLRREGHDTYIIYPYKINTELFSEIKDFFSLDKKYVAQTVIKDIEDNRKERVLPRIFALIPLLNFILPVFALDWISTYIIKRFIKSKID